MRLSLAYPIPCTFASPPRQRIFLKIKTADRSTVLCMDCSIAWLAFYPLFDCKINGSFDFCVLAYVEVNAVFALGPRGAVGGEGARDIPARDVSAVYRIFESYFAFIQPNNPRLCIVGCVGKNRADNKLRSVGCIRGDGIYSLSIRIEIRRHHHVFNIRSRGAKPA